MKPIDVGNAPPRGKGPMANVVISNRFTPDERADIKQAIRFAARFVGINLRYYSVNVRRAIANGSHHGRAWYFRGHVSLLIPARHVVPWGMTTGRTGEREAGTWQEHNIWLAAHELQHLLQAGRLHDKGFNREQNANWHAWAAVKEWRKKHPPEDNNAKEHDTETPRN